MDEKYMRLDCRIKRYNRINPASFIIDAAREPAAAAVFDRRTYESLDHRKGQGPRPLKTHAYNFSYIEDDEGKALIGVRAANREEAEAFAVKIMEAAKSISREAYLEELDRVIWPQSVREEPGMRSWQARAKSLQGGLPLQRDSAAYESEPARESYLRMQQTISPLSISSSLPPEQKKSSRAGERKDLVKETVRLMEQMDLDDMRSLYRYALLLLEG